MEPNAVNWAAIFDLVGPPALAGWLLLLLAPRWPWLLSAMRWLIAGGLSIVYAALMLVYFFRVEGGGYDSLAQVKALFQSDPVLLAGWVHYLAFDLFVGIWLAERLDAARVSRLVQAPILLTTLMFGPIGLLIGLPVGSRFRLPSPARTEGNPT